MKARKHWRYWTGRIWTLWAGRQQRELFRNVETYCMFIGHGRSGHSIYAQLLNAHPQAVISHECDALMYVKNGISRDRLFALILREDRLFAESDGRRSHGFHHAVPNQWQGRFERLRVIGDKKAGVSTSRLGKSPQLLADLRRTVKVPVKIIHIVRNPFDNISSIARYNGKSLAENIPGFFSRTEVAARIVEDNAADSITLRHEDFVADPEEHLKRLVEAIGLEAERRYLADCASAVFESPTKSRLKAQWNGDLIQAVQREIENFPFLRGYTYDS